MTRSLPGEQALLIEKIAELVMDKKLEGISEIRDENDRQDMRRVSTMEEKAEIRVEDLIAEEDVVVMLSPGHWTASAIGAVEAGSRVAKLVIGIAGKNQMVETFAMFGLKNLLKLRSNRVKQWKNNPSELPWFDQPNALILLEQRRKAESLSDSEFEALRNWVEHGYVVLRDVVPVGDVDGMMSDLDNVWTTTTPIANLKIDDLRIKPEDPPGLDHSKLVQIDAPTKARLRRESRWRIHEFISHSESAMRIFRSAALSRWSSLILGRKADPSYTINFTFGSEQGLHQDTAVFAISPMNHIVGAWLACEDIDPESGPLIYYPGSHRENLFAQFDNYPQTILRTCTPALTAEYQRYLDDIALRYERRTFIAKKGEWFLWHGMMIHGGEAIRNPNLTRRSYVCHYIPQGMNKEMEIEGPFNW